jgi:hypothetical protein
MQVDYAVIEKLHAMARRERAREIACLIQRAIVWIRARLRGADPSLNDAVCCAA